LSRSRVDRRVRGLLLACALCSAAIALAVVAFLGLESLPAWRDVGAQRLFGGEGWFPAAGAGDGRFGLGPMLVGTLACALGAVALAAPLGVLSAAFCCYYAPRPLAGAYRRVLELMAGIPSVVYGFWGLATLAPVVRRLEPPGTSLLTGVLVLTLMVTPTVALLAHAAFRGVPAETLRGAAALSLSRWRTLVRVVVPATRSELALAVGLAGMRALGETMAVLMVCGNVVGVPASVFDPVRTLTANIALELGYATGAHRSALFASGLVLMGLVVALVAASAWPRARRARSGGTA